MTLSERAVRRPVSTLMFFLALLLMGVVSIRFLPIDLMPDMELPSITLLTYYPGAGAEEVESQVTKPLEGVLSATEQVRDINSSSKENVSTISMSFDHNTDINEAANNIRDRISLIESQLPSDAEKPVVMKINSSMLPVIIYSVTARESYSGINKIIEDQISTPVRTVSGVGTVINIAQPEREIRVLLHPKRMNQFSLTIQEVREIMLMENLDVPSGIMSLGKYDFAIKTAGTLSSLSDIERIVVANCNGQMIRLQDIATVQDGLKQKDEYAKTMEGKGVAFMVQKQSGANTVEVVSGVRQKMEEIRKKMPDDVQITEILVFEEVISESIKGLSNTLFVAILVVACIVLLFLREWRSSLIIVVTIPFSLIVAFIAMYAMGYTINMFSLIALLLAVGMVVDNAIVILENIVKHIEEKGEKPSIAAVVASDEMRAPIIASTATTLMVFLPLIFLGGIVGIMFRQLAFITSVTMIASLVTALSLTPMLGSRLLLEKQKQLQYQKAWFFRHSEHLFKVLENGYMNLLRFVMRRKGYFLIFVILIIVGTVFSSRHVGTDYLPNFDAGDVIISFETEQGASASFTDSIATMIMEVIQKNVPEKAPGMLAGISGQTEMGILSSVGFSEGKNKGTILCHLIHPRERKRSATEVAEMLRTHLDQIPEIASYEINAGSFLTSIIFGIEQAIEIEVGGSDLNMINRVASDLVNSLMQSGNFNEVNHTIDPEKPEYHISLHTDKLSKYGLTTAMCGDQLRQMIYGARAGVFKERGEEYDIMIQYDDSFLISPERLKDIYLSNIAGDKIPLYAVADVVRVNSPIDIKRSSQQRVVYVYANTHGISLGEAENILEKTIDEMEIPFGVHINIKGQIEERKKSFAELYWVLILGILLVYMIMAAQFESFVHPFVIMFAVPVTFIGIVWALIITGTTLNITAFIGVIMLSGIVVNNAIILVDYINQLRRRGDNLYDAIIEGGRTRMRPVLMTSFTTMLGMLPMVFSRGIGSEFYAPIGITLIGGLLISMLITLLLIPVMYFLITVRRV